jgi:PAS domain S-box-containing protein
MSLPKDAGHGLRRALLHTLALFGAWLVSAPLLALDPDKDVEDYVVKQWTEEQRLPHRLVWSVCQTRDGYIWLGTQDGLVRFDGLRATTFSTLNASALSNSAIRALAETPDGTLWIATTTPDLIKYANGQFTPVKGAFVGTWQNMGVRFFFVDSRGTLWLTNNGGIAYVDASGRLKSLAEPPATSFTVSRRTITEDSRGRICYGAPDGVRCVEGERVTHPIVVDNVRGVRFDREGDLWYGVDGRGLFRFRKGISTPVALPAGIATPTVEIYQITADRHGNIWVGTNNGLCRIGRDGGVTAVPALADMNVQDMIEDASGSLWIASRSGLFQIKDPEFRTFTAGTKTQEVLSLIEDRAGTIWFVTHEAPRVHQVRRNRHSVPTAPMPERVRCLLEDRVGRHWAGTQEGVFREEQGRWHRVVEIPSGQITVLHEDPSGHLWAGGAHGMVRRIAAGGDVARDVIELGEACWVEALLTTRDSTLWIATRSGVFKRQGSTTTELQLGGSRPMRYARSLHEDAEGTLWIGTRAGLVRVRNGHAQRLGVEDGLPDPIVNGIVDDREGRLWVGCSKGVYRIAKRDLDERLAGRLPSLRPVLFGQGEGIRAGQATGGAALRTRDGSLWFGTLLGVATVPRARLGATAAPPAVYIEKLVVDERSFDPRQDAVAPPGDRRVEIHFTALSFEAPEKIRFRYLLEDFDREWRDVGGRREATYTRVSPGRHTFRVAACNSFGVCNDAGAVVSLRLQPYLYERPVFFALLAAVAGGLLWAGYRWRVSEHKARQRDLEKLVEERTTNLKSEIAERQRVQEQVALERDRLHALTNDLQREVTERVQAEEAVRRLAGVLEERVRERTAELEAAKVSLEDDIAIRRRTEEALSQEKERLAVTLRSIGDGVIATGVNGEVVLVNRAAEELTGWGQVEAVGRPLSEVFPTVDRWTREPLADPVQSAIQGRIVTDLSEQTLLLARDGHERLVALSAAPIRDRTSRITGVVLVSRDITEKRRLEEHLANTGKLESIGILAAGIAHDFNNLLTGVFSYIDLARARSSHGGEVYERLTKAIEVLDRSRALAGQLLTFTKGGVPVKAPGDVGILLRNAAPFALAGSNVTCRLTLPDDLWPCEIDAGQIGQVIDNLLINARQAMPQGGSVEVTAANVSIDSDPILAAGRYVKVVVEDHGTGIPLEHRSRVFDLFFSTKPHGSGVGLPTAYSIIKRHGGHIEFDSTLGEGTTFSFYLPTVASREMPAATPSDAVHLLKGRVLVMDDEEILRDVLRESLETFGLRVDVSADAHGALALARSALAAGDPFDLALLDLTIPGGMGGVEALAQLRAIQPSLKAVASSGYSSDPVMAAPEAFGFQAMLTKPYVMSDLFRTVAPLLANAH